MKLKTLACVAVAAVLPKLAYAQDTIRIGVIAALSGPFTNIGKPFEDGIKTFMQQHGDQVAGKKIEIIYRDDGGINAEMSKRAAQELIAREKVSFLIGFSLTPSALAVAPIATQAKIPMIVMNAVTTGITAKSPYMLRTGMTMQQMTEPFGTWTAKNSLSPHQPAGPHAAPKRRVHMYACSHAPGHRAPIRRSLNIKVAASVSCQ
ncbi:ABC transporter substrate-binding protein [Janthinobacterium sp. HLX7-2]|uniref:ABC transporter substrate-binding protein n=1 Tax=Janthinobacterium sp. HLX7-2 TaxID=1259331 RepID=UPI003F239DBF